MAARLKEIPARMAIGFLPGTFSTGSYTVRAADAHAWPELWFPELGWTRFEPTPGGRAGAAPAYSLIPVEVGPSASATATAATPAPSASLAERPDSDVGATAGDATTTIGPLGWLSDNVLTILVILATVLALVLLPVAAWVRRRRLRLEARDDAERVRPTGPRSSPGSRHRISPTGSTPSRQGPADPDATLSGASKGGMEHIATVERARYAHPQSEITDVVRDNDGGAGGLSAGAARQGARLPLPGRRVRQWTDVRTPCSWPARLARLIATARPLERSMTCARGGHTHTRGSGEAQSRVVAQACRARWRAAIV